jgi:glycosyltransferase involved in cell wall biosynthesis
MHILVITPGFPGDENDTNCIPPMQEYFHNLVEVYPTVKITVVSIHYPYKNSVYIWKNVKVYSCGCRSAGQPKRIFYWLRAINYARIINKKDKIDIIHSFWLTDAALIGTFLSKLFNVRHINTMMGQDVKQENNYLKLLPLNNIIKVAVSEFQSKVFCKSTGKNSDYIIPWGLESVYYGNNKRNIDLIGVGALIPVKNFKFFIEIITELKKYYPAVNCLLIGDGIEKHEIEFFIKQNNLKENVSLTGHIPREEVLKYMKRSKVLLHTSGFESFGYVIAEALASGCYVVCKNVGCATGSGKIVMADNIYEFTSAVSNILDNKADYRPELLYPLHDTVSSYMNLYGKIFSSLPQNNKLAV